MDQKSICSILARKGLSARDIHDELVVVLGLDAIADSTIINYRWQQRLIAIFSDPPDQRPIIIIDDAILDALDK
jgi:hypothetical protein